MLLTCYSPVRRFTHTPKGAFSLDLHVLSTPPAFALSQDQTLQFESTSLFAFSLVETCNHPLINQRIVSSSFLYEKGEELGFLIVRQLFLF